MSCQAHEEQYCEGSLTWTYNGTEKDGKTPTYGGYSSQITVDENYVLRLSSYAPLEKIAPLLCAGITTYSPLKHFKVTQNSRVAVVGLGGLGHMGVKLAAALGADVTVLSTSASKKQDAIQFGAHDFINTKNSEAFAPLANRFDFILDTGSATHDLNAYLSLLKTDGTLVLVGAPEKPTELQAFSLILKRRRLAGSLIGGIRETQEMLDFCASKNITADVEVVSAPKVNEAYERVLKKNVRYRFVLDLKTL
jgi:uncharacterized zinc-type alcohol dehydrogenase-like protein